MAKSTKSSLPITRSQFRTAAKSVTVVINGKEYTVPRKEFSTGSLGWYLNDKMDIEVDGQPVKVQIGLNLTIVGSKELPPDPSSPQPTTPPAKETPAESGSGQAEF